MNLFQTLKIENDAQVILFGENDRFYAYKNILLDTLTKQTISLQPITKNNPLSKQLNYPLFYETNKHTLQIIDQNANALYYEHHLRDDSQFFGYSTYNEYNLPIYLYVNKGSSETWYRCDYHYDKELAVCMEYNEGEEFKTYIKPISEIDTNWHKIKEDILKAYLTRKMETHTIHESSCATFGYSPTHLMREFNL